MGNMYASVSGKGNDNRGKERRCEEYIYTKWMGHVTICTDIITLFFQTKTFLMRRSHVDVDG